MKAETRKATEHYGKIIDKFFNEIARLRGKPQKELAMLLYGSYASVHCDYTGNQQWGEDPDYWEAEIMKRLGDMLMVRSGCDPLKDDEIERMFVND